jgi:hypothetical protein
VTAARASPLQLSQDTANTDTFHADLPWCGARQHAYETRKANEAPPGRRSLSCIKMVPRVMLARRLFSLFYVAATGG